jgi:chromosome segregation ATPase
MLGAIVLCLWGLIMVGCATTDDPRQGGLFGYNPAAYERRIEERQQTVGTLEKQRQTLQEESRQLQGQEAATRQIRDEQRAQLAALDAQLVQLDGGLTRIQRKVETYRAQTAAKQKEKQRVMNEVQTLKKRLDSLRQTSQVSAEKIQQKEQLEREIDTLLEASVTLTSSR